MKITYNRREAATLSRLFNEATLTLRKEEHQKALFTFKGVEYSITNKTKKPQDY